MKNIRKITQEERLRVLEAGKKILGIKEDQSSDLERLVLSAQQKIKVIRDYAMIIDKEVRAAGKDHNLKMLQQEIQSRYRDAFMVYTHEEIFILMTFFLTQQTIKEIV